MRTRSKIVLTAVAGAALLALVPIADSADGTLPKAPLVPSLQWWQPGQSIISAYAGITGVPQPVPGQVVPVNVTPPASPLLSDVKEAVADSPDLTALVNSHGYAPSSVIGLGQSEGSITVFVSKAG